jgi:error-prone DNA polymerase
MSHDDDYGLPPGVEPDTPGAHVPRIVRMQRQMQLGLREAANDPAHDAAPAYAELHCLSDFTFLRGAASAEELFARAAQCGYEALAITDECSLSGIVRAHEAAKITGIQLVVGAEFRLDDGLRLVLLVENAAGYAQLCRLITTARRAAGKGAYHLTRQDLARDAFDAGTTGLFALWLPTKKAKKGST